MTATIAIAKQLYSKENPPKKTYATYDNAVQAAQAVTRKTQAEGVWFVVGATHDGRYFPIFIGSDANCMMFQGFALVMKG